MGEEIERGKMFSHAPDSGTFKDGTFEGGTFYGDVHCDWGVWSTDAGGAFKEGGTFKGGTFEGAGKCTWGVWSSDVSRDEKD